MGTEFQVMRQNKNLKNIEIMRNLLQRSENSMLVGTQL